MKVLLVEDDERLGAMTKNLLEYDMKYMKNKNNTMAHIADITETTFISCNSLNCSL